MIAYTTTTGTKHLLSIEQHKIIHAFSKTDSATNGDIKSLAKMDIPASEIGLIISDLKSKGLIDCTLKGKRYNNLVVTAQKDAVEERIEIIKPTVLVNGLNAKQAELMALVDEMMTSEKQRNVINVVGEGGTGKSFVIHRLKEKYGEEMIITATTGIAAQNIGGCTIHSYLGLKPEFNHQASSIDDDTELKGLDLGSLSATILVIDESSMMGYDLFQEVMNVSFQLLILSGDSQQLPPVKSRAVDFEKYPTIELTEQMRTKSNAYKLIKAYREAKEADCAETINFNDYIDGESVQSIKITELVAHFKKNKSDDKRVISFKNETADSVIDAIKPKSKIYQLLSALAVWSPGSGQEILAVNGDTIEIERTFKSWGDATNAYRFKYGEECKHRTKWKNDTKLAFTYASIKGIDTHFVCLLFGQRAEYLEVLKDKFKKVVVQKKKLKDKHGENWELCKSPEYNKAVSEYMAIKSGVVRARHICSCTAHKAQGQSIKTCYVIVSEMENNPALMYVALSRAINKIVLVY